MFIHLCLAVALLTYRPFAHGIGFVIIRLSLLVRFYSGFVFYE